MEWTRVRELFRAAGELPKEERAAYLERACAGDTELRDEVSSLLDAAELDDAFLERPPVASGDLLLGAPLESGTRIGDFTLVRRIASGGMGVVYEAEQREPRRRVALKIMQLGLPTESARRRFRYEAEVLASLRHPSIATVHATGVYELDGRELPWFAMELVEDAVTIVEHAERTNASTRTRLELFRQVCDAVHHGHLRGVIHRDLKPENLLVGSDGRPRVIDFGVARATDADLATTTLLTEPGAIVGTLTTMSPEQVAGEREQLDLRTDVYSLGVVLFRLLTGAWPQDVRSLSLPEAARAIREDPPTRPSRHVPDLRGDLDTILLKALEKEPARRYTSAAALSDDLGRFLAGEPIRARPPSALYQARLFARRHRAAATALVLVVLVSIAAAIVSTTYALRADDAAADATRRFELVRGLGGELLGGVLDELEDLEGATQARAEVAATALEYLDALEREAAGDVELLRELASGHARLADFRGAPTDPSLGEARAAVAGYERSLALWRRVTELADPRPEDHDAEVGVRLRLARLLPRVGRSDESEALLRTVLAESEGARAAAALCGLGDRARARGEHAAARAHFEAALTLYTESGEARDRSLVLERLGNLALDANDFDEAERRYTEQRALQERLAGDAPPTGEDRIVLVNAHCNLANLAERRGDADGSLAHAGEAVELARSAAAADPDSAYARDRLALALDIRGVALRLLGRFDEALASFRESAELYERNLALDPGDLHERTCAAEIRVKQAGMALPLGRAEEAVPVLRAAVAELDAVAAEAPDEHGHERALSLGLDVLTQALLATGDLDGAHASALRFLDVGGRYAARAAHDAFAQRQVMLGHNRIGGIELDLAHADGLADAERAAHLERAADGFRDCLETFETLRENGHLYPGDENAKPWIERELERCEAELAELGAR